LSRGGWGGGERKSFVRQTRFAKIAVNRGQGAALFGCSALRSLSKRGSATRAQWVCRELDTCCSADCEVRLIKLRLIKTRACLQLASHLVFVMI
jgi:hypothetical protein